MSSYFQKNKKLLTICFYGLLLLGYTVYFIIALVYNTQNAIPLIALTSSVVAVCSYEFAMRSGRSRLQHYMKQFRKSKRSKILAKLSHLVMQCFVTVFGLWLVIDVILQRPQQLLSLVGLALIMTICIWGSKYPEDIIWRPVIWGMVLQLIFGFLVLRTRIGYQAIRFIGDQIEIFLNYTDHGAGFVFGNNTFKAHYFAFKLLSMIVFFSSVTNMLYHLGLMQWFISKLAFLAQITLGTSAIECTVAVANIFVDMVEAPSATRPYLGSVTKAEIHSIMTSGFGSISFSVIGVFMDFQVDAVHLLTACVMSAPASLAVSRLLYPEKEKSSFTNIESLDLTTENHRNVIEAAADGAWMSISLVANTAANLIAFLALLAFTNSTLQWFGAFVGLPQLTFELLCGYVFAPIAFLLGADWEDCFVVGKLFGLKTFLNELIAYQAMGPYIKQRLSGGAKYGNNGEVLYLSERSELIAIYALCGFCNIGSLGITVDGLNVLMPHRRTDIADMAVRSFFGGILTCWMTASIAGFLFVENMSSIASNDTTFTTTPFYNHTISTAIHDYNLTSVSPVTVT